MSKTLFVGIDAHLEKNTVCFLDQNGNKVCKIFSFPNNLTGFKELETRIVDTMQTYNFDSVKIGTESTSFLDFHIVYSLAQSEILPKDRTEVYQFNPKVIAAFKKIYIDKDKTDPTCAFVIADQMRFGRLPQPVNYHQHYFPLQRLTRFRYHIVETIAREKNYFIVHLFLKYSSYLDIKPFSNTFGATSLAVITEFLTPDELAQIDTEALVQFVLEKSKKRIKNPHEIVERLQYVARESYRIRPELAKSVNLILVITYKNIQALQKSLKEVDKAITEEFKGFRNPLLSIHGLGPVYAAGIFAEIGNIKRFKYEAQIAKSAGLTWRKIQSGNFNANITRMTKTGNKYLRYYLIAAANSLRVHNVEYRNYYRKKYDEVTRFKHKRALVLTARKLVRLVYALLSKQQLYSEHYESNR